MRLVTGASFRVTVVVQEMSIAAYTPITSSVGYCKAEVLGACHVWLVELEGGAPARVYLHLRVLARKTVCPTCCCLAEGFAANQTLRYSRAELGTRPAPQSILIQLVLYLHIGA